jgi:hypothetical protein
MNHGFGPAALVGVAWLAACGTVFARDQTGRLLSTVETSAGAGGAGFTRWTPLGEP